MPRHLIAGSSGDHINKILLWHYSHVFSSNTARPNVGGLHETRCFPSPDLRRPRRSNGRENNTYQTRSWIRTARLQAYKSRGGINRWVAQYGHSRDTSIYFRLLSQYERWLSVGPHRRAEHAIQLLVLRIFRLLDSRRQGCFSDLSTMLSLSTLALAGLAVVGTQATPVEVARRATPTVYLAGDSTMARMSGQHQGELCCQ